MAAGGYLETWDYHVFLELAGNILDLIFGSNNLLKTEYFDKMFFEKILYTKKSPITLIIDC